MRISKKPTSIKIGNDIYDEIHPQAVVASKVVTDMWLQLGKPTDPFSEAGKKLVDLIIAVWEDCYPNDAKEWRAARAEYQGAEKTIQEQVRQKTGRSLASYPYAVFAMMTAVFSGFDPAERKNCIKMVELWPMFRFANKV